jgi:hypothetical protein
VTEVLAPGLELLSVGAAPLTELSQGISEAMRVEIRQTRPRKCIPEYLPDRSRAAPTSPLQPQCLECPRAASTDPGFREQWIVIAPKEGAAKVPDPFGDDAQRLFAYWKKPGADGLATLGRDGPPVLENMALGEIDMLQFERRQGAVAGAGQDRERDRGDLFEKRRRLMADWATFCGRTQPRGGVVSIRRQNAS